MLGALYICLQGASYFPDEHALRVAWSGPDALKCCLLLKCVYSHSLFIAEASAALPVCCSQIFKRLGLACRRRIYCVLRSPHVNKDSREHFEKRTHSRLLDIKNLTAQTIDELMQLDLPAGVDVEVKL